MASPSIPDDTYAISFERFSKSFGEVIAVERLDLEIERATIHGLLGPNGAGKTTAVRALCGLLRPTAGRVLVLGFDAHRDRLRVRSMLGYMPQVASLYQDLTAHENITFFARGLGVPDAGTRADQLLELMGLGERRNDPVHTFSGGMRQRVSLACALVHDPPLLLLDEPTAGTDPVIRRTIWRTLEELRDRGRTVVVTTNQLDEAAHADRLAILRQGRLLVNEEPESVLDRGKTRVTLRRDGREERFELADYERELPRLLNAPGVDSMRVERETLEDVMLRLVQERQEG
jgi:ABC-type multidrug transport system ATPase subunit